MRIVLFCENKYAVDILLPIYQEAVKSETNYILWYVHLPKISQSFRDSLPESTLLYNFTDQFILGTGYTYSFNNYNPQNRLRNTHSMRLSFEMAGNLLYALSAMTGADKDDEGRYKLFGINYAQFVKGDVDFSKSIVLDSRNKLAFHVGVGVGYPYGNSKMLPFERSYFSGGANSVRGWSVRSLGPGSIFPFRTEKLSLVTPMVLRNSGRVGSRRFL